MEDWLYSGPHSMLMTEIVLRYWTSTKGWVSTILGCVGSWRKEKNSNWDMLLPWQISCCPRELWKCLEHWAGKDGEGSELSELFGGNVEVKNVKRNADNRNLVTLGERQRLSQDHSCDVLYWECVVMGQWAVVSELTITEVKSSGNCSFRVVAQGAKDTHQVGSRI